MRRTPVIGMALVVALGFTAGACGGDDGNDPDDIRAELSEQFQEGDDGFSKEQADCFADVLVDEVGADELADVDFTDEEPPEDLQEAFTKAAIKAVADCDIPLSGE